MAGDLVERGKSIYKERLKPALEPDHKGEIVAIEVDSGDYFLGKSEIEAYDKAVAKHPGKRFAFLRVGFRTTHYVGAL